LGVGWEAGTSSFTGVQSSLFWEFKLFLEFGLFIWEFAEITKFMNLLKSMKLMSSGKPSGSTIIAWGLAMQLVIGW